jgi:hypothetical protein
VPINDDSGHRPICIQETTISATVKKSSSQKPTKWLFIRGKCGLGLADRGRESVWGYGQLLYLTPNKNSPSTHSHSILLYRPLIRPTSFPNRAVHKKMRISGGFRRPRAWLNWRRGDISMQSPHVHLDWPLRLPGHRRRVYPVTRDRSALAAKFDFRPMIPELVGRDGRRFSASRPISRQVTAPVIVPTTPRGICCALEV